MSAVVVFQIFDMEKKRKKKRTNAPVTRPEVTSIVLLYEFFSHQF